MPQFSTIEELDLAMTLLNNTTTDMLLVVNVRCLYRYMCKELLLRMYWYFPHGVRARHILIYDTKSIELSKIAQWYLEYKTRYWRTTSSREYFPIFQPRTLVTITQPRPSKLRQCNGQSFLLHPGDVRNCPA